MLKAALQVNQQTQVAGLLSVWLFVIIIIKVSTIEQNLCSTKHSTEPLGNTFKMGDSGSGDYARRVIPLDPGF